MKLLMNDVETMFNLLVVFFG